VVGYDWGPGKGARFELPAVEVLGRNRNGRWQATETEVPNATPAANRTEWPGITWLGGSVLGGALERRPVRSPLESLPATIGSASHEGEEQWMPIVSVKTARRSPRSPGFAGPCRGAAERRPEERNRLQLLWRDGPQRMRVASASRRCLGARGVNLRQAGSWDANTRAGFAATVSGRPRRGPPFPGAHLLLSLVSEGAG